MKTAPKLVLILLVMITVASSRRRDPLTEAEADQLREVAQEPYKRLKLYVQFTEARLTSIDELRADPKEAQGRGKKIHDLLEDFTTLMDEINSNLDAFEGRPLTKDERKDFHKGLKEMLAANDRFAEKLKSLKTASESDPQTRKELPDFRFVLQDAEEAVKSSQEIAREYSETSPADDKPVKKK